MTISLVELFDIGDRELVAFVGGGGKSTLTLGLGRELHDAGRRIAMTTTTKMGIDQIPTWATTCNTAADARVALGRSRAAYLIGSADGSKVIGVEPAVVDGLYLSTDATIAVEADERVADLSKHLHRTSP